MEATPNPRRLQFGLRTLLVAMAVGPVVLAAAAQVPGLLYVGVSLCVLLALAVGCLDLAKRVSTGQSVWHECAAGTLICCGVLLLTLQILGGLLVFFLLLDFAL